MLLPDRPSLIIPIFERTDTFLPARTFLRSVALKLPRPPIAATSLITFVATISDLSSREYPPLLVALNIIWSSLKSVFITTTVAPLDMFHTVAPLIGSFTSETTFPAFGATGTSGSFERVSLYGSTCSLSAF